MPVNSNDNTIIPYHWPVLQGWRTISQCFSAPGHKIRPKSGSTFSGQHTLSISIMTRIVTIWPKGLSDITNALRNSPILHSFPRSRHPTAAPKLCMHAYKEDDCRQRSPCLDVRGRLRVDQPVSYDPRSQGISMEVCSTMKTSLRSASLCKT
jgi:hypothetical protein